MKNKTPLFLISLIFMCFSCAKNDDIPTHESVEQKNKTVLFYVVGDIDLWEDQTDIINILETSWNETFDGNLLVYLDPSPRHTQFSNPVLLKIVSDSLNDVIISRVVKDYPNQDPFDGDVMKGVLSDVVEMYPAKTHGLAICSHGSAWLDKLPGQTRSLGGADRYGTDMKINTLATILPVHYEFIFFRACYMGNVETAYELKNNCDYIIASSEVFPAWDNPLMDAVKYFFTKPRADLHHFATTYIEEYNKLTDKQILLPFFLSAIRTSKLDDLAAATKTIMEKVTVDSDKFYGKLRDKGFFYGDNIHTDLAQIIFLQTHGVPELEADLNKFQSALRQAVINRYGAWKRPTQGIELLDPKDYCGLSNYTPIRMVELKQLNDYHKTAYKWAVASGFNLVASEVK